jgi:hypothetical protein
MIGRLLTSAAIVGLWLLWGCLAVSSLAALVALSSNGTAAAAVAELKIADLDCNGSPEVVEIENEGPDPQDLAGWKLLSNPPGTESFDLTPIGSLPAAASVFIESGPSAEATFKWSSSQVFRDNDPTDFARLVDETGQTRDEAACSAQATTSPSPSPSQSPAPTPTPTTAPAGNVPNGGGPPGDVSDIPSSPLAAIVAGGALLGIGATAVSAAWLGASTRSRRRGEPAGTERNLTPPSIHVPITRAPEPALEVSRPLLLTLVVAIAAAIVVSLLFQHSDARNRN